MASPPTSWRTCRTSLGNETLQMGAMPAPIVRLRRSTSALQGTVLRHVHNRCVAGPVPRCVQHSRLRLHPTTLGEKKVGLCLGWPMMCALPTNNCRTARCPPIYSDLGL